MATIERKKRIYLVVLVSLLLSSLACRIEAPKIILSESPTPTEANYITQVVTEIVTATPAPVTATLAPTNTPQPTLTPTFDPGSAPIYYPLPDCSASRLYIGDKAFVSLEGGPNAIRLSPDVVADDNVITYADPGSILTIVAGPYCDLGYIIWLVETRDQVRGFTPEGNGNEYWLFPLEP
jgi:hypothetical protein